MKRSKHAYASNTLRAQGEAAEFFIQETKLAFLTGRAIQFIDNLALNAEVPLYILAERVSDQLGNSESGGTSGPEENLPALPVASTKKRASTRKVAVARGSRDKVLKAHGKVECPVCKKDFYRKGIGAHTRLAHGQSYKAA